MPSQENGAAMRSSMFVLRVLTMLAFVVLLPVVAIMGVSLPASVRQYLEPAAASRSEPGALPASHEHESAARPFAEEGKKPIRPDAIRPEPRSPEQIGVTGRRPQAMANTGSLPPSEGAGAVPPTGDIPPAPWRSPPGELPQDPGSQPLRPEEKLPAGNYPTTGLDPLVRTASAEEIPPGRASEALPDKEGARGLPDATPRRADPQQGEFHEIQQRLQELGATYYRLETWAGRAQFRFHCRMAVRDNSHYSRNFEAMDADPMAAMRRVLEQVERWRAGATPRP